MVAGRKTGTTGILNVEHVHGRHQRCSARQTNAVRTIIQVALHTGRWQVDDQVSQSCAWRGRGLAILRDAQPKPIFLSYKRNNGGARTPDRGPARLV